MHNVAVSIFSVVLLLTGCMSTSVTTLGSAYTPGGKKADVFAIAVNAAMESGMDIQSVNETVGLIVAEKASHALLATQKNIRVNIVVTENSDGTKISIKATLGGQMVDYGMTESVVQELVKKLDNQLADSKFFVGGKPYFPNLAEIQGGG